MISRVSLTNEGMLATCSPPKRAPARPAPSPSRRTVTENFFNRVLADNAHTRAAYSAPAAIARCIEAALSGSFANGEALEARLFNDAAPPSKRVRCGTYSSPSPKPPRSRPGERCAGS